jgi:hypothetical protein
MTELSQEKYLYVVAKDCLITQNPIVAWRHWQQKKHKDWALHVQKATLDRKVQFSALIESSDNQEDVDMFYQKHVASARTLQLEKIIADAEVELAALQVEAQ